MKAFAVFAAIILFGWAAVKAVSLAIRGLVHLLVAGLPVGG